MSKVSSKKLGIMRFISDVSIYLEIYDAGISLGLDICQFMPLHLSAWDIAGKTLAGWCKSWMGMDYSPLLSPVGWFEDGHRPPGSSINCFEGACMVTSQTSFTGYPCGNNSAVVMGGGVAVLV